jgi:hypothetical protein
MVSIGATRLLSGSKVRFPPYSAVAVRDPQGPLWGAAVEAMSASSQLSCSKETFERTASHGRFVPSPDMR